MIEKDHNEEIGDEKEYFAMLKEVIVAEYTKKFLDKIGKDNTFSEEAEVVRKFRDWVVAYYRLGGIFLWKEVKFLLYIFRFTLFTLRFTLNL